MELLKSNYAVAAADVEPTEASLQLDTDALPAPSIDSQAAPTASAAVQPDLAPRRFAQGAEGLLYVHKGSLLGWHRVLGHPVRCRPGWLSATWRGSRAERASVTGAPRSACAWHRASRTARAGGGARAPDQARPQWRVLYACRRL